jgi:glycosyltransferase 2 family protein
VPAMEVTSATAIGVAASTVLPLRLGEFVRPALLARRTDVAFSAALASVVVERVLDLLFILLCFVVLSSIHPLPAGVRAAAFTGAIGASAGFALLLAVQWTRPASERLVDRLLAPLPAGLASRAGALVRGVLDGAAAVAEPATALVVVALSALLWGAVVLVYVCLLLALRVAAPPLAAGLASVVIVAAFVALPQAPGFVGTWQAGCVVALGLFAVPDTAAVGYALLTWIVAMGSNVAFGGFFAAWAGLGPRDVLRARDGTGDRGSP